MSRFVVCFMKDVLITVASAICQIEIDTPTRGWPPSSGACELQSLRTGHRADDRDLGGRFSILKATLRQTQK
jgi:hypothetical protein